MNALVEQVALLVSAAGVVTGVLVALSTRRLLDGLPVMLELLLAAGLLRLALLDSWVAIVSVALVVVVRKLAVSGIRLAASAGRPWPGPRRSD